MVVVIVLVVLVVMIVIVVKVLSHCLGSNLACYCFFARSSCSQESLMRSHGRIVIYEEPENPYALNRKSITHEIRRPSSSCSSSPRRGSGS